jgi:hypothetical protein
MNIKSIARQNPYRVCTNSDKNKEIAKWKLQDLTYQTTWIIMK